MNQIVSSVLCKANDYSQSEITINSSVTIDEWDGLAFLLANLIEKYANDLK